MPKFARRIPKGLVIDRLVSEGLHNEAISLLRAAERKLTLSRKMRTARMMRMRGTRQAGIDAREITKINRRLGVICRFLRS